MLSERAICGGVSVNRCGRVTIRAPVSLRDSPLEAGLGLPGGPVVSRVDVDSLEQSLHGSSRAASSTVSALF